MLQHFYDQPFVGMAISSPEGDILRCNDRICGMLGYTRDELVRKRWVEVIHPDDLPKRKAMVERFEKGEAEAMSTSVRYRHKDGSLVFGQVNLSCVRKADGSIDFLVATLLDVSQFQPVERKAIPPIKVIDKILAAMPPETTQRILQGVEQSPVSIIITDRAGSIQYVNSAFVNTTGYAWEEVVGRNPSFLKEDTQPAALFEGLWRTLASGREWRGVFCNRKKNGQLFWERATVSPIFDERQEVTHFLAVKEDITQSRWALLATEAYRTHLEKTVHACSSELMEAREAALRSERIKDEFLANISHELRTPLSVVIGFADLALCGTEDPKQRDYLEKINGAGKNLATIINDLLDLSRLSAGRLELERAPFDLRERFAKVLLPSARRAKEKGLVWREWIDPLLPPVLVGDGKRCEQILLNLLGNAIKCTTAGRIGLRVQIGAREAKRVRVDLLVEDTGVGLRESEFDRLFKPFSPADSSISHRIGGAGVGLAISQHLAEMMGGGIEVTSRPGQGSTFVARIWLDAPSAEPPGLEAGPEAEAAAQLAGRELRVLVVDDQPVNLEIAEELLRAIGVSTHSVTNGQEAVDCLANAAPEDYQLVLMDMQMPVMDGLSATRAIRELGAFSKLPIIAFTAHVMDHEKRTGLAAGIDDYIAKPFEIASFYRTLAKWLAPGSQQQAASTLSGVAAG